MNLELWQLAAGMASDELQLMAFPPLCGPFPLKLVLIFVDSRSLWKK